MSEATARRGIDFVIANALAGGGSKIGVHYHGGGEPTRNWPVLAASQQYARRRSGECGLACECSVATNGCLSELQVDWILANLRTASVSMDGLPEVHDRNRFTADGSGTSAWVMRTLRRFDAAGFGYGVRLTATASDIASLPDSVEFILRNCRPASILVEPVYRLGRASGFATAETEAFLDAFRQARAAASRHGVEVRFSAVRVDTLTNHFCSATAGSFCLSAAGNVTSCYEVFGEDCTWAAKFFYGRPAAAGGGYDFDAEVLANLQAQAVEHRAHCRGCFAKWHCGGDCYHKILVETGPGEFHGTARCRIIRELTKDLLLSRIEGGGGWYWRGTPCRESET
jgi:uncharacterized protein